MNREIRNRLCAAAIGTLATLVACLAVAESVTVVSWGGSYAKACVEGYHKAFTAETGIEIRLEDYNGGLAEVRAQVDAGAVHWDVVDVELADGVRGCDEGLFTVFDPETLPPSADGSAPEDDYYPGMITECGANTLFYSTIYAYNAERIEGEKPTTMQDFFDLERFPGRRGMRRSPVVNLEFALMGDGVPVEQVYAVLDTEAGIERAFRKLDSIKDQVVWWEAGAQPPQMLADGEVVMSTAYNGGSSMPRCWKSSPSSSSGTARYWTPASSPSSRAPPTSPPRNASSSSLRVLRRWPASLAASPSVPHAVPPRRSSQPMPKRVWRCVRTCPTRRRMSAAPCTTTGSGGATTGTT